MNVTTNQAVQHPNGEAKEEIEGATGNLPGRPETECKILYITCPYIIT